MPKFAVLPFSPFSTQYICSKFKNFFLLLCLQKKKTAFSTAVDVEELCQHVFLLLGYQSPNTTTGISSSLPETLIGLAATNLIGHWRLVMWIHTEPPPPKKRSYLPLRKRLTDSEGGDGGRQSCCIIISISSERGGGGDRGEGWVRNSERNTAMGRDRNVKACLRQLTWTLILCYCKVGLNSSPRRIFSVCLRPLVHPGDVFNYKHTVYKSVFCTCT